MQGRENADEFFFGAWGISQAYMCTHAGMDRIEREREREREREKFIDNQIDD